MNQKTEDNRNNSEESVNMNTGRAGKYIKLEKISKEAQSGKIDYTLKDDIIGQRLSENGIGNKGENVGKGLLEKSGFKAGEKVEPKTKFEKNAVRQMERANLKVYKQFDKIKGLYNKGNLNNLIFHLKGIGIDKKTFNDKLLPILKKN